MAFKLDHQPCTEQRVESSERNAALAHRPTESWLGEPGVADGGQKPPLKSTFPAGIGQSREEFRSSRSPGPAIENALAEPLFVDQPYANRGIDGVLDLPAVEVERWRLDDESLGAQMPKSIGASDVRRWHGVDRRTDLAARFGVASMPRDEKLVGISGESVEAEQARPASPGDPALIAPAFIAPAFVAPAFIANIGQPCGQPEMPGARCPRHGVCAGPDRLDATGRLQPGTHLARDSNEL